MLPIRGVPAKGGLLLMEEAAFLADVAYEDGTDRAERRGWRPLGEDELGDLPTFEDGIHESTVGTEWGDKYETVAHVYQGRAGGEDVVALAFRGTDQGSREALYAIGELEDYDDEHRELVDAVTEYVREGAREGSIDRLLITGHSLGGILAEEAADGLDRWLVRKDAAVLTFGSPGSPEDIPPSIRQLNVVHTDDALANIEAYADDVPDWIDRLLPGDPVDDLEALERDGRDIEVNRPEGRPLDSGDADELFETLYDSGDWEDRPFLVEHDLDLYLKTASRLEDAAARADFVG